MIIEDGLINYYAKRKDNLVPMPNSTKIDDITLEDLSNFKDKGIIIKSQSIEQSKTL